MTKQNKPKSIEELLRNIVEVVDMEFLVDTLELQQSFKEFVNTQKDGGCDMHMVWIENGKLIPMDVNDDNIEAFLTGEDEASDPDTQGIDDFVEFLVSLLGASEEQDDAMVELADVEDFIRKIGEMISEEEAENSYKPHARSFEEDVQVNTLAIQKRALQAFLRRMGMRLVYTDRGAYGEYTEETKRAVPYTRAISVMSFDKCVRFYNEYNARSAKPINPKKLYLTIRDKEVVADKHLLSFHRPEEGWAEIQSLLR